MFETNDIYDSSIQSKVKRYYKQYGFRKGALLALQKILLNFLRPLFDYQKIFILRSSRQGKSHCGMGNQMIKINYLDDSNMRPFKEVVKRYSWHDKYGFIEPRLKDNEKCILATIDEKICAYLWIAPGERTVTYNSKYFFIKDSEVFLHDLLTIPEFRGQGIMSSMIFEVSKLLHKKGCKSILAFVSSDNYSSIRSFQKNGFKIYQVVRFINSHFFRNELSFVSNVEISQCSEYKVV